MAPWWDHGTIAEKGSQTDATKTNIETFENSIHQQLCRTRLVGRFNKIKKMRLDVCWIFYLYDLLKCILSSSHPQNTFLLNRSAPSAGPKDGLVCKAILLSCEGSNTLVARGLAILKYLLTCLFLFGIVIMSTYGQTADLRRERLTAKLIDAILAQRKTNANANTKETQRGHVVWANRRPQARASYSKAHRRHFGSRYTA